MSNERRQDTRLPGNMRWRSRRSSVAIVLMGIALGGVAGCGGEPAAEATRINLPATLEEIEGQEVNRITLTDRGAERLGLMTAAVEARAGGLRVPYAALLYDAAGQTWVYTNPEPLVFIRQQVTVERIDADIVLLTDGPQAGTQIVTVGAAELLGAELDTAN
jgi:hypothetical protein